MTANMPYALDEGLVLTVETVDGGTRQDLSMSTMPLNAWIKILNAEYGDNGELQSRGGEALYNSTALSATMDNGCRFYKESTGSKTLIVSADTGAAMKIYKGTDATGAMTEITGGTALTTALPVEFITFRNYLLITNGTQTIQYLDDPTGTTKVNCVFSDNNRKAKFIAAGDNRIWVVDPAQPNRVYVSEDGFWTTAPGTDCSFPTNNWIAVPGNFNDKIIGLQSYDDEIFVFQTKAIWVIYGEDLQTWGMRKVAEIGALNQRAISIAALGDDELGGLSGILFVNERSIWFWDPNAGDPVDIGKYARDTFNTGVFESSTYKFTENVTVGFSTAKKQFHISFRETSSSAYNDHSIVVDEKLRVTETTQGATAYIDCSGYGDTGYFYRLSPNTSGTDGYVIQMNTGTQDIGVGITITLKTKHFNMGKNIATKRARTLFLGTDAESQTENITVRAICDRGASVYIFNAENNAVDSALIGVGIIGVFIIGGSTAYQGTPTWFPFGVQFKELQLEITKEATATFKLYYYEIEYEQYPVRRN